MWSDLHLIGGRDVLDSEDFIVSNLLLPGGSLIYLLFCVTKWGWGFDNYLEEANAGKGLKNRKRIKTIFPVCASGIDFIYPNPGIKSDFIDSHQGLL